MALNNLNELNPLQMDVLREIGNIGSGNSATSLAQILSSSIDIGVPTVRDLEYNEVIDMLGGPEQVVIGLLVRLTGDIKGMMMYLLKENFANKVTSTFYGKETTDVLQLDEMDRSAICEMGNIMASSYVNAIAQLSGLFIDISVPAFCADMVGAIMSVPAVEFAEVSDRVLFIDDMFKVSDDEIRSNMILIPEMESLKLLFTKLGVEI